MKKILVTGGAGFIGSHTVVELINSGYTPVIIDDFSNSDPRIIEQIEEITDKDVSFYQGNFGRHDLLRGILDAEGSIDGVIHFAAYKAVGESVEKPLDYYRNNISEFISLLDFLVQHDIRDIVFSSSCTVYGEPATESVDESAPRLDAESPYGNTKRIGEDILTDLVKSGANVRGVLLRYFNPIGAHPSGMIGELPQGRPNNLVPFITQTAAGRRDELTVNGGDYPTPDGTCIRDYIHVVDLAKAHVKALDWLKGKPQEPVVDVFNLGTGQGNSVLEVINTFESVTGVKIPFKIGPRRSGDVVRIYANPAKAAEHLNWKTELSLADALKHAWQWETYLSNNW